MRHAHKPRLAPTRALPRLFRLTPVGFQRGVYHGRHSSPHTSLQPGVTVYVEPRAIMHIIGTTMDFVEDDLTSEFVFHNPNAEGSCGCGESFTTKSPTPGSDSTRR